MENSAFNMYGHGNTSNTATKKQETLQSTPLFLGKRGDKNRFYDATDHQWKDALQLGDQGNLHYHNVSSKYQQLLKEQETLLKRGEISDAEYRAARNRLRLAWRDFRAHGLADVDTSQPRMQNTRFYKRIGTWYDREKRAIESSSGTRSEKAWKMQRLEERYADKQKAREDAYYARMENTYNASPNAPLPRTKKLVEAELQRRGHLGKLYDRMAKQPHRRSLVQTLVDMYGLYRSMLQRHPRNTTVSKELRRHFTIQLPSLIKYVQSLAPDYVSLLDSIPLTRGNVLLSTVRSGLQGVSSCPVPQPISGFMWLAGNVLKVVTRSRVVIKRTEILEVVRGTAVRQEIERIVREQGAAAVVGAGNVLDGFTKIIKVILQSLEPFFSDACTAKLVEVTNEIFQQVIRRFIESHVKYIAGLTMNGDALRAILNKHSKMCMKLINGENVDNYIPDLIRDCFRAIPVGDKRVYLLRGADVYKLQDRVYSLLP